MNRRNLLTLLASFPFIGGVVAKALAKDAGVIPDFVSVKRLQDARNLLLPGVFGHAQQFPGVEFDARIDEANHCLLIIGTSNITGRSGWFEITSTEIADNTFKARFWPSCLKLGELLST